MNVLQEQQQKEMLKYELCSEILVNARNELFLGMRFMDHGGSLVMIAKGNRTQVVTDACQKHGGFYLGTIGGIAAVLSQECITSIDCVEYPELGMEAIWKITVKNFPAFILVDDKGHDFFKELKPWAPCKSC